MRTYQDKKGKAVAVVILTHTETPGLGSKATDFDFLKAFGGRDLALETKDKTTDGKIWSVTKDNPALGFVDAISGATITSRAVMELVHKALAVYNLHRKAIMTQVRSQPKEQKP